MSDNKSYKVVLSAYGSASYWVEASSPEEAYRKACDEKASLSDVEVYDWMEGQGEILNPDGTTIEVKDLKDE